MSKIFYVLVEAKYGNINECISMHKFYISIETKMYQTVSIGND